LAESIAGDPAPYDPGDVPIDDPEALAAFFSIRHARSATSSATKRLAEDAAVERLISLMPSGASSKFRELWDEYEAQESAEARFVKQVDVLEAFLQSRAYVDRYPHLPFDGFRLQALEEITHPVLAQVRDERLQRSGESGAVLE
jgi:putative hydrolase of HD superfamily